MPSAQACAIGFSLDREVTVCSACLRASCWYGIFVCDDYKTAGTVELTIRELIDLGREHTDYFMVPLGMEVSTYYRKIGLR